MPIVSGGSTASGTATAISSALISATPPGSPSTGSIWVYPADDTNGMYWMFVYDAAETTYKWRFVGGPPLYVAGAPNAVLTALTQVGATGNWYSAGLTAARAGDYAIDGYMDFSYPTNTTANTGITVLPFAGAATLAGNPRNDTAWWTASAAVLTGTYSAGNATGVAAGTTLGLAASSGDATHISLQRYVTRITPVRVI